MSSKGLAPSGRKNGALTPVVAGTKAPALKDSFGRKNGSMPTIPTAGLGKGSK